MIARSEKNFHPKGWGGEYWLHNDENYCAKLLVFNKGKRGSFHFHKTKQESFLVNRGRIHCTFCDVDEQGNLKEETRCEQILDSGSFIDVPSYRAHQLLAIEDSEIVEFSTQHFEEDSYRLILGD